MRKLHSLLCIREIPGEQCIVGQFWLLGVMCHTPLICYEPISKYRQQIIYENNTKIFQYI